MENDQQTQQAISNLVVRSANQIAEGKSKAEVVALLEKEGCPADLALAIATKGEEIKKAEFRKGGTTSILIGVGLCALGIAITAGSYSAASGGGHYVITGGLIMGGAWIALKGIWRSMAD